MEFKYQPMFEHGEDKTQYYLLTKDYVFPTIGIASGRSNVVFTCA
jgi:hypothetical protein